MSENFFWLRNRDVVIAAAIKRQSVNIGQFIGEKDGWVEAKADTARINSKINPAERQLVVWYSLDIQSSCY